MTGYDYGSKNSMRTKLKSFILSAVLIGLISFCTAQQTSMPKEDPKPKGDSLAGKWFLVPALPSDTATGHLPEVEFSLVNSHFSGSTGCNRMSGSFLATDSSLHFSDNIITTRMFCAGYNEPAFLKNLLRVNRYKFDQGQLIFLVGDEEVFRWSRAVPKPKKTLKA
jgi:heat shock protein HslJ